jgi:serine/threonine protein kinase
LPAYSITTDEEGKQILLLKYASNGNLEKYYKNLGVSTEEEMIENDQKKMRPKGLSWTQRLYLVRQFFVALRYMHSRGIFHRDLKPTNIMVNELGRLLLGDFGASIMDYLDENKKAMYSRYYADKDSINNLFTPKSDVYSFALCCYFILFGEHMYT